MLPSSQRRLNLISILSILLLLACTPALNWRDVRLESTHGSTLKATLPCKPDTATRKQQLGDSQVELSMMGCIVNDVTFTLSHIHVADPLAAPKVLAAWQAAAVVNVKAVPSATKSEFTSPATISGAGAWPPAVRATLIGDNIQAQMLWFAKQGSTGLMLYQVALYDKQDQNKGLRTNVEADKTFFESLQLQ